MSYSRYLCLFAYGGVQHILCCVFVLFVYVMCILCCQFLWIINSFIGSSVFWNVNLNYCGPAYSLLCDLSLKGTMRGFIFKSISLYSS